MVPPSPGAKVPMVHLLFPVLGAGSAETNLTSGGYFSVITTLVASLVPIFL